MWSLASSILIFYLLCGATVSFAQGGTGRYPPPPPTKKVSKPKPEPPATVTASGEVRPIQYLNLTSEVVGRIQEIYVTPGEQIKKNQALVLIDSSEQAQTAAQQAAINEAEKARDALAQAKKTWESADAAVTQAKKDYATAETDWNTADREFKRAKDLVESRVLSAAEYEAARDRQERAKIKFYQINIALMGASERADHERSAMTEAETKAQSTAMRANYLDTHLRSQSGRPEKTTQVSPIDGIVADMQSRPGEVVLGGMIGTTLMTLADMSAIYVEVDVEETEISRIEVGQQATIIVDAFAEKRIRGVVTRKDPQPVTDSNNRGGLSSRVNDTGPKQFRVTLGMREMSGEIRNRLRPGMSATATITTKGRS
jgi:HlyD family secretion protein